MESVSDSLRRLAETKHRFTSAEAGWQRFLHFLHERKGQILTESTEANSSRTWITPTMSCLIPTRIATKTGWPPWKGSLATAM
jgi:hypothetical protein